MENVSGAVTNMCHVELTPSNYTSKNQPFDPLGKVENVFGGKKKRIETLEFRNISGQLLVDLKICAVLQIN